MKLNLLQLKQGEEPGGKLTALRSSSVCSPIRSSSAACAVQIKVLQRKNTGEIVINVQTINIEPKNVSFICLLLNDKSI